MTENEFIHIAPQLRQLALQISQGYGIGSDEAEDIAQDAMLKLWAVKDDIQSDAHAKGSMGCIAKHLCIDLFRKRKMISIDAQPFDKSPSNIKCFICDKWKRKVQRRLRRSWASPLSLWQCCSPGHENRCCKKSRKDVDSL